jgi:nicotinamidase-related amidase
VFKIRFYRSKVIQSMMSRSVLVFCVLAFVACKGFKYDPLSPSNAALLLVDHQTGLANGVKDQSMPEFMSSVVALAGKCSFHLKLKVKEIGKLFNLPTIVTSSAETGPNGPLLPGTFSDSGVPVFMFSEILQLYANDTIIRRPGEINAWDNPDFVKAVSRYVGNRSNPYYSARGVEN